MSGERVHVLSPRTWGEFGNYLAATRFTAVLRDQLPGAEVTLLTAESLLPWVGDVGARIRDITLQSPDTATRTRRYQALMAELAAEWPAGCEAGAAPPPGARALDGLVGHLRTHRPDLVVGAKPFVARLCLAAANAAAHADGRPRPRVAAHVTNPGLLGLDVHRSACLDLTFVGFEWARTLLVDQVGAPQDRVRTVGPLVAQHELGNFLTGPQGTGGDTGAAGTGDGARTGGDDGDASGTAPRPGAERPEVIVFSNRGGDTYLRAVEHLARRQADVDLVFVGYGDEDTTRRAAALAAEAGEAGRNWRFHTRLRQAEYFAYIDGAARRPHSFLVSKAGPATVLEAAYFGIPVLTLDSGLPMEAWVPGLVRDQRLGRCCRTGPELLSALDAWLDRPETVAEHRRHALAYARTALDQDAVGRRIGQAVRDLLRHDRAPRTTVASGEPL
ncbi:glycosyltransferase [Streptomyces sp. NPDC050617]|uniref:glycosyltransferase n=1 Tax=Streptomyces sp. NPDC050617 TaxID=3154628 RepID=UPI0034225612